MELIPPFSVLALHLVDPFAHSTKCGKLFSVYSKLRLGLASLSSKRRVTSGNVTLFHLLGDEKWNSQTATLSSPKQPV